jgi:hypothetical protein
MLCAYPKTGEKSKVIVLAQMEIHAVQIPEAVLHHFVLNSLRFDWHLENHAGSKLRGKLLAQKLKSVVEFFPPVPNLRSCRPRDRPNDARRSAQISFDSM